MPKTLAQYQAAQIIADYGIEDAFITTRELAAQQEGRKTRAAVHVRRLHAYVCFERIAANQAARAEA